MKRQLFTLFACLIYMGVSAQSTYRFQYWFDNHQRPYHTDTVNSNTWHTQIDVGYLYNGIHTLNLHVQDSLGKWSSPRTYLFYKAPDTINSTFTCAFWFDQNSQDISQGGIGNGHTMLNVAQLNDGLHTLNIQLGLDGASRIHNYLFYKLPLQNLALTYTCWFDGNYTHQIRDSIGDGHIILNVDTLSDGLHTIDIQLGEGNNAFLRSSVFYKFPEQDSMDNIFYSYWFDQDYHHLSTDSVGNGHLLIDVDGLESGIHSFNIQVGGQKSSLLKQYLFYKMPLGGYGITRYEYALNGNWLNSRATDILPTDTLQLITLLPVDTVPIRSTCFQYIPNNNHPVIYAKNDITFHFINNEYRYAEKTCQYVDYNMSDTVYADTLERDTTKVIAAPRNNNIRWFKLAAGVGDSLSFHTDRRCTMQLYAPSGERVFHASGDSVLSWNGCYTWENGDYYLAVHDAEGTGNIAVSYQWIYKYAVLEHSPGIVGNAPAMVTVHLLGNGFDKLINVRFFNADTVWLMDSILASNINEAYIDFFVNTDLPIGYYNMLLEFSDTTGVIDSLIVNSSIRVVPAEYGNIVVNYDYVSSFTEPHIITVTISNTGNVPYVGVPIVFARTRPNVSTISFTEQNLILDTFESMIDYYYDASDLWGQGIEAEYIPLILNRIEPYQTLTMQMEFNCPNGESFDFYAYAGKPWSHSTNTALSMCDMPDPCDVAFAVECVCGTAIGIIKAFSGALAAPVLNGRRRAEAWARENGYDDEIYGELPRLQTPGSILREVLGHCVPDRVQAVMGSFLAAWELLDGDDCPNPNPIHPSVPARPLDPNEIIGYSATSGSLALAYRQMQLPYLIEYENDSLLASGMAHIVIVKDTFDGNIFDLETFSAISFSIGNELVEVNGGQSFTRTVDLRPEIGVLAQVQLNYSIDSNIAIATWTFSSIDPMTLLPTVADTLGFLRVGGTGEVQFSINRKNNLMDSTIISNRAHIIFDNEDPIATSTWINIMDITPPVSSVDSVTFSGGMATVAMSATDNLSGVWRYNVYGQVDSLYLPLAMNMPVDSMATFVADTDMYIAFLTTAIDSAGNVEPLHLVPLCTDTTVVECITICDSLTWHGTTYTASTNTPSYTTQIAHGCDSITTLHLTVNYSNTGTETLVTCDNLTWHGNTYTASTTTPTFTSLNAAGCDSVTTLHLTVNYSNTGTETLTTCDSLIWHGNTYTVSTTTPTFTSLNALGCDSITTLHLTVNYSNTAIETLTACDSLTWHDSTYYSSTLNAQFSTHNLVGCDSVTTLLLTINYSNSAIETITACDSLTWHDSTYTASTSSPQFTTSNSYGCDSVTTLYLTINYSVHDTIEEIAVDSFFWDGQTLTESGTYPFEGETLEGCDSIVILNLIIIHDSTLVNNVDGEYISLYPNPTKASVTIEGTNIQAVRVYSAIGQEVLKLPANNQNRLTIDIDDLPDGFYIFAIDIHDGTAYKKVVKKK